MPLHILFLSKLVLIVLVILLVYKAAPSLLSAVILSFLSASFECFLKVNLEKNLPYFLPLLPFPVTTLSLQLEAIAGIIFILHWLPNDWIALLLTLPF